VRVLLGIDWGPFHPLIPGGTTVGRVIAAVFSILLLLVSMYLFGFAFQVDSGQAFVFIAGVLLMSLSFFLPIHVFGKR
jgi:hypothetical protein